LEEEDLEKTKDRGKKGHLGERIKNSNIAGRIEKSSRNAKLEKDRL